MKKARKPMCLFLSLAMLFVALYMPINAESAAFFYKTTPMTVSLNEDVETPIGAPEIDCKSAILMEAKTGTVLYTKNAHEALPPASVTKIMTLLLIMEAVDTGRLSLNDTVTASANAASMGGSQVYLKEGERMTLEDMLKSVVIASANDAAVALAEHLCGSVESFVHKMNQRAEQLGMTETHFENVTGLDDTAQNHLTSAHDIALMSRELIRHKTVLNYSSVWMDSIRNGEFGLTNTNRLVRFYNGCTGLKTGSTQKAGFCVSATAERDGMSLICVIMGAETRDLRNESATALLDWGFASYGLYTASAKELDPIEILGGVSPKCNVITSDFSCVLPKGDLNRVEMVAEFSKELQAPVSRGDCVGRIRFLVDGREIGSCDILSLDTVSKIGFFDILKRISTRFLLI